MPQLPEQRAGVADADLSGTTALVTGSTSGIGRELALSLGRLGARVLVHGRDRDSGRTVVERLADTAATDSAFVSADLASQSSVREFAGEVSGMVDSLDLLYNNAGGIVREGRLTDDGAEQTFAINHLAPFLLTHRLLPVMSADGRIVTTSSGAHWNGHIDFENLQSVDDYSSMTAYARSKLANVLFTRELARRTDVVANCFRPGFIPGTSIFRELPLLTRLRMRARSVRPGVGTSVEQGAASAVYLGVSDEVSEVTGSYFSALTEETPCEAARDEDTAGRLWEVSEEMVGLADDVRLSRSTEAR